MNHVPTKHITAERRQTKKVFSARAYYAAIAAAAVGCCAVAQFQESGVSPTRKKKKDEGGRVGGGGPTPQRWLLHAKPVSTFQILNAMQLGYKQSRFTTPCFRLVFSLFMQSGTILLYASGLK